MLRNWLGALEIVPDGRHVYGLASHNPHIHTQKTKNFCNGTVCVYVCVHTVGGWVSASVCVFECLYVYVSV